MKKHQNNKRQAPAQGMHMILIYGTLLPGESNHYLLSNAQFVSQVLTLPEYDLLDISGHFPAMISGGNTAVKGEVYIVDKITLAAIDRLEGHPKFYKRTKINLADRSVVETYLLASNTNRSYSNSRYPRILSGDWRTWKTEKER